MEIREFFLAPLMNAGTLVPTSTDVNMKSVRFIQRI